jgi:hypothetical protein
MVDAVHWWGENFDPVLIARPVWWKVLLWLDVLVFGPFYPFAIYAFIRGKSWIRIPAIIYAAMLLADIAVILGEELFGPHRAPQPGIVLLTNAAWVIFPLLILFRLSRSEHPFAPADRRPDGDPA